MRMKLGMGTAVAAGLAVWVATGVGAAAQESLGTTDRPRSSLREQCEALAQRETESQEALPRSEVQRDREPAAMNAPIHRSAADEPLRHERRRWQAVTPAAQQTEEERAVKAAARHEAAQFGVIALLSPLPRADADAPSPWARAVPTGGVRDDMFDGTVDTLLRVALR